MHASALEPGIADALRDAQRVVIFGGAFDPPHRAHVELPRAVRAALGADLLLYIPAAQSPLKAHAPECSDADRVAMVRAAIADDPASLVTEMELRRAGVSYTIDTLRALRDAAPNVEFRLLIGADQARNFHRWRDADAIIELAEPVVMLRGDDDRRGLLAALEPHWAGAERDAWAARIVEAPLLDVSSTRLRDALDRGDLDDPFVQQSLPEGVRRLIRERRLYRSPSARSRESN